MSGRLTRSQALLQQQAQTSQAITSPSEPASHHNASILVPNRSQRKIQKLNPEEMAAAMTTLSKHKKDLLFLKQGKLQDENAQVPSFIRQRQASKTSGSGALAKSIAATLVFAQEAAGTAICISPNGLLLTCSHCIADTQSDYEKKSRRGTGIWLLFASGVPVLAKPIAWDSRRDLALLQIVALSDTMGDVPYVHIAKEAPRLGQRLLCIGHPGSEDFEAEQSGVATGYDVLHISEGRYRGLDLEQDVQDNEEIGAMKHDCWTYWGHSGAPLIEYIEGRLVGLHSSWDDETGMRRGVAWEAVVEFLGEHTRPLG